MQYDPKVIMEFAERLYSRANSIIISYTIIGIIIGGAGGMVSGSGVVAAIAAVFVGAIGYYMGTEKAFQYKLQAQTALCQIQIEKNTNRGA